MNLRTAINVYSGGAGSGCDPAVAEAHGTKCGRASEADLETYKALKKRWAEINDELLDMLGVPDSPEVKVKMKECKEIVKKIHTLNLDFGGREGVGLPGGTRDIAIVGAGPGGLAAAVMGATDGLDTLFIDAQTTVGGQSKFSSRIENFPGFPIGASGRTLATNMYEQATRLGAQEKLGVRVTGLTYDQNTGVKTLKLSNGEQVKARTVILAGGVEFRELDFPGSKSSDVIYANSMELAKITKGKPAVVLGGSNGAAQAALGVAKTASHVYVLSRSPITKGMSDYQVEALKANKKITVIENDEIEALWTDEQNKAKHITTKGGRKIEAAGLGIFIGGTTNTDWLPAEVKRDDKGKIHVNRDLETSMPGVFAIGDNRVGAIGRIGGAVGDGQIAERNAMLHFDKMYEEKKEIKSGKTRRMRTEDFNRMIDALFALDEQHPYLGQMIER